MKMKKKFYTLALFLIIFSCAAPLKSNEKVVTIDTATKEKIIELNFGETVKIEAESNPSTGYNWNIEVPSGCNVEFVKEDSRAIYKDNRVGAPIIAVYEFKAKSKGECEVEFDYSRAWEGKSKFPNKIKFVVN